jgi:hypothetical protein
LLILHDPDRTHVDRKLAPAAGQVFTPHLGFDALRREETAYEVGFECMTRSVELFHERERSPVKAAANAS